jgi:predicted CopG family antitoxin
MGSRIISLTDEAYDALSKEKRKGESFTEAILRLTRKNGKLSDCFGTWEMSDKEEERVVKNLTKNWKRVGEHFIEMSRQ